MQHITDPRTLFENAKKLTGKFEHIEVEYIKYLSMERVEAYPDDKTDIQLKTIVYLLARACYVIESNDEAVDFLSMQVKHVDLSKGNGIRFNWIAMSGVEYDNFLRINKPLHLLFFKFQRGKDDDERIFDGLTYQNILDYLQMTYEDGLGPVDFIVYMASKTFEQILNKMSEEWLASYPTANRYSGLMKRYKEAITYVQELLNHKHLDAIDSYIDPRIFVSWAKKHHIPFMVFNFVYSAEQQEEMRWANDEVDDGYTFFNPISG